MAVEIIGAAAKKRWSQEFPGSPAVRTLCSHCRRPGFSPWLGNWDPTSHSAQQKTKKNVFFGLKISSNNDFTFCQNPGNHRLIILLAAQFLSCVFLFLYPFLWSLTLFSPIPSWPSVPWSLPNPLGDHWSRTKERKWQHLQPFPITVSVLAAAWLPHWR